MADINGILYARDKQGNLYAIGGRDGKDGPIGPVGPTGPQGIPGPTGPAGPSGASNAPAQNQRLSIKTTPDYAGGPIALVGPNGTVSVTPGSQNAQAIADAVEAVYASGAVITGNGTSAPGVTGISNPDTAPTFANTGSLGTDYGSNFAGDFFFAYTYTTASGETAPSPTTLLQVSDEGNRFLYTAPSLPSGATGTKWYSSRTARAVGAGGDTNLGFIGTSTGNTFTSTDSPVTGAASPPSTNSTGGPASLNITLDLAGTLAGTNPTPLSTTTAGVAIQVLQYGAAEGPGAALSALNAETVARQAAIALVGQPAGYTVAGASASTAPSATGFSINTFYKQGTNNVSTGTSYKAGTGTSYYFILDGDQLISMYNGKWYLGFYDGSSLFMAYSVAKNGPVVPSTGWVAEQYGGTTPPTSVTYNPSYEVPASSRNNHTGTQKLSTISDAGTAASKTAGTALGNVNTNGAQLSASQVVETDASGLFITAVKADAYNKPFGTASGTIAQGNDSRLSNNARTNAANTFTAADTTTISDAVTNALTIVRTHGHNSSGTPAAGFGLRERFQLKSSTTNSRDVGYLDFSWVVATDGSRTTRGILNLVDFAGTRECLRLESNGSAPLIGFLGASAQARTALPAAATDAATTQTLVNAIRTLLINVGLAQ